MGLRSLTCAVVPHGTLWRASAQRQFWAPGKLRAPKGTQEISKTLVLWKLKKIGIGRISLCSQFSETHLTHIFIYFIVFSYAQTRSVFQQNLSPPRSCEVSVLAPNKRSPRSPASNHLSSETPTRVTKVSWSSTFVLCTICINMSIYVNIICQ